MKIISASQWPQVSAAAFGVFQDQSAKNLPSWAGKALKKLQDLGEFNGQADQIRVVYTEGRPPRLLFYGLGESRAYTLEKLRQAIGRSVKHGQKTGWKELTLDVDSFRSPSLKAADAAEAAALAAELARYIFREFKTRPDQDLKKDISISLASQEPGVCRQPAERGWMIAESVNQSRTLANRPGNRLYPEKLAAEAQALARKYRSLSVKIMKKKDLEKAGFGALLAVGSGSQHAPVLIELAYHGAGPGQAPVAVVGKGITFDSGGISLKPAAKMEDMRFDMSGAAAVMGVLQAAARLKLRVNILGVIPAAENLPSGSACRPGDIVTSLSGQTIEVLNTDAEGRLILADALTYAARRKTACIIDLATLTGAVSVALGNVAMGMLCNDERLAEQLRQAARGSGEKIWQLPLWEEYRELIKSENADMANIGSKPGAGTIVGGIFLQKFVQDIPWAHLDIAGTAYGDETPLYAKGAYGTGVRLVIEYLSRQAGQKR